MENTRNFYRLEYREQDRPTIRIGDRSFPVADLSEGGVRFFFAATEAWTQATHELSGVIQLDGGEEVPIRGSILRAGDGFVVLRLSQGIPLAVIMREQQRLLQKYRRFREGDLASSDPEA
jgi:hypothetical protein